MDSLQPVQDYNLNDLNYDLNDRTRIRGSKLIVKHFNTSVAKHF